MAKLTNQHKLHHFYMHIDITITKILAGINRSLFFVKVGARDRMLHHFTNGTS